MSCFLPNLMEDVAGETNADERRSTLRHASSPIYDLTAYQPTLALDNIHLPSLRAQHTWPTARQPSPTTWTRIRPIDVASNCATTLPPPRCPGLKYPVPLFTGIESIRSWSMEPEGLRLGNGA